MDDVAVRVLAAEQREQITYLHRLARAPWWWHAAAAARNTAGRIRENLAALLAYLGDRRPRC